MRVLALSAALLLLCHPLLAAEEGAGKEMGGEEGTDKSKSTDKDIAPITDELLMKEEHWAMEGCIQATSKEGHYHSLRQACRKCVLDTVEVRGDPTRCHQCVRPAANKGKFPSELLATCLGCVPNAEKKHMGWACTQYCAHHTWEGKFMNEEEANQCLDCLYSEHPVDKWGCHVCMEQNAGHDDGRLACYKCVQAEANDPYQCAYCSRVPSEQDRDACFDCMKKGVAGKTCAAKYGVQNFVKPGPTLNKEMQEKIAKAVQEAKQAHLG